ncbi:unnamed protein product [Pieris macdunnoughi]|uniref:Uncharacterized protein n=1 Tax=Pieris macdunnoughi TaxID=345717 RepID=A0A821WZP7_9NEOP|nr:unnamed protein product [Pieris macdunnoughi]
MIRLIIQVLLIVTVTSLVESEGDNESKLSSILLPSKDNARITRSYYERYGYGRPYDRLDDRRCGRCDDDDDSDDDRDDRRSKKPIYGSRHDRNRDEDDNDDKRYNTDRRSSKNETDDQSDDKSHDDKDRHRDRPRNRHRNRYDDRDRYGPDYYDRFLRDRNRDRYDRYDEPYPRRPLYDRNAYSYDDGYGRYDGNRRPAYYDDRYDRYDDGYGGYGPGVGAGPHDSFRPWDETYRGQSGWDAGGRGYYFASGRPDSSAWSQRDYARPQSSGGWQSGYQSNPSYSNDYASGYNYKDPYRGTSAASYGSGYGGYQDVGYGQSSGWRNVGETRRPYRDERSPAYDNYQSQNAFYPGDRRYGSSGAQTVYGQTGTERRPYRDESGVTKLDTQYNQVADNRYGRPSQPSSYQPLSTFSQSTTQTSYLLGREDQLVKVDDSTQKDAQ